MSKVTAFDAEADERQSRLSRWTRSWSCLAANLRQRIAQALPLFCVIAFIPALHAEVRLPALLSDHAVLQRGQPIHIWGWAAPAEKVSVTFHGQQRAAVADALGMWQVFLAPEAAGGPFSITVAGDQTKNPLILQDILVGDVWVASGQSNMEFPLKGFAGAPLKDGDKEIAQAKHGNLRLLLVKRAVSSFPLGDLSGTWKECTPETAADFSAVAYFFGREIAEKEHVAVGLIDSTWGGTPAMAWTGMEALGSLDLGAVLKDAGAMMEDEGRASQAYGNLNFQDGLLRAEGKTPGTRPRIRGDYNGAHSPSALYNGMIAPLTPYTIKGIIWYQGEADAGSVRAGNYERLFSAMIRDWRRQWGEGDIPFFYAQISSFDSPDAWGELRDAQRRTLALRNTAMAVTLDVGAAKNVHPPDKQTVGMRLAFAARNLVYGESVDYASPEFVQATPEGDSIRAWLAHADGLSAHGETVGGFEVAGGDGVFVPATARIEQIGDKSTVLAKAPGVASPRYIRYGWSSVVNDFLYNRAGLPMGTFSSY